MSLVPTTIESGRLAIETSPVNSGSLTTSPKCPYDFSHALRYVSARAKLPLGSHMFVEDDTNPAPGRQRLVIYTTVSGAHVRIDLAVHGGSENKKAVITWRTLSADERISSNDFSSCVEEYVRRMICANVNLSDFYTMARAEKRISDLPDQFCGMKPTLTTSVFDAAQWAIVGQQVSLSFALTLKERLRQRYGEVVRDGATAIRLSPTPESIARARMTSLRAMQLSDAKARYLKNIANATLAGGLPLDCLATMPYDEAITLLTSVKGIGQWSANYILMRGAGHLDALPLGDAGLRRAIKRAWNMREAPDDKRIQKIAEKFRPYRSLFTLYLWQAHG